MREFLETLALILVVSVGVFSLWYGLELAADYFRGDVEDVFDDEDDEDEWPFR